jgi:hypothetical protein
MPAKWLVARWAVLFPALEQVTTEEEVKRLCEDEIQIWREQPSIKKESSLRNHMTETHHEIEKRMKGDKRGWALTYLAFSEAWYKQQNAPSRAALENRLEHQQLLQDPDAIVNKAVELLSSENWPDLAVALGVCTGRRPGEVLKTATFEPKTMYSVIFTGQLKRRGDPLPPYEIPTLCQASAAMYALARLRAKLDTTGMDVSSTTRKYSPLVQEAANTHFQELIPARHGKDDLYGHLFRSVYPRIACFWYCPPTIADMHFMATIQGHTDFFELETEEARRSYGSQAHYSDYRIADSSGNIDGRQGLKLGTRGVELLEVFKPKPRKEKAMMTTTPETQDQTQAKPEGKNVPVTVDRAAFNRVQALRTRLGHRTYGETVNLLLDFHEQGGQAAAAKIENVADAIRSVLSRDKSYQKFQQEEETADAAAILEKALADGEGLQALLVDALTKEAKFKIGLTKRHAGKDFSSMSTTQLTNTKDRNAARERIRRAVAAIAAYNDQAVVAERWFINPRIVQQVSGARYPIVEEYFKEHQAEIDALNTKHELNQRYNSKAYAVKTVVTIPEQSEQPEQPGEEK